MVGALARAALIMRMVAHRMVAHCTVAHRRAACRWFRRVSMNTYCVLCARDGQPGVDLCQSCEQQFKAINHTDRRGRCSQLCLACAEPMPGRLRHDTSHRSDESAIAGYAGVSMYCPSCQEASRQVFSHIVSPYRYAFPLNQLIKRVKYSGDRQLTRVLGHLLAKAVRCGGGSCEVQVLIPMPLHPTRLSERGFNQAQDIAHWCGAVLGIKTDVAMAQRVEATESLAGLNRQERRLRILGVFRASESVAGKRVAIVDDVMTTGASAGELARELYDSGALSVELWVLARTSSVREGV